MSSISFDSNINNLRRRNLSINESVLPETDKKMTFFSFDVTPDNRDDKTKPKKWSWYWAPVYCAIWFALFYVTVIPSFYSYPETLLIRDEAKNPDEFIGERAQRQLLKLSNIGNKLSGSIENEVHAVNFLKSQIEKIIDESRKDLYTIEMDVQYPSGKFFLWSMAMSYDNISNVIVKIAPKNSVSETFLLVNAHYDSEVSSPAAADDGVMVVIMLETLRVISRSERELKNPIVFLFNGAEEANMLASHGFITQHRWAPYCKALINLDSAGSGGREVLFQSGPDHPWLMKYYKQSARHPYATTIAEELFQSGFVPSDTDFRVFRDYGNVPGLDMAHTLNGYVYHTKYDNFQNLERGTYQTTGDNVLALTRALANAPELENTAAHAEGHTVFYDFLGWFLVYYTETTGIIINCIVSVSALICIGISIYQMSKSKASEVPKAILLRFITIQAVQIVSIVAAVGITLLIAVIMGAANLTESWYYKNWMTFGLYFCTMFLCLSIIPGFYITWTKKKTNMLLDNTIACFMHAHCIVLVLICLIMTGRSIRSAFFPMIGIFFYTISLVLNFIAKLVTKKNLYVSIHLICQLLPYWFYTYLAFAFLKVFTPMQGRDGPTSQPDLVISSFVALMTLHFAGFILPILHKFHKSKTFFSMFGVLTLIFIIIAATPAGFPFQKIFAEQRYYVLHTNRILHNADGSIQSNEAGFYVQPVDTRYSLLYDTTLKNAEPASWTTNACASEPYCGLPLYSGRWLDWKDSARWINASAPVLPIPTQLTLVSTETLEGNKKRFNFSLRAADRIILYIQPHDKVSITNWSFDRTPLDKKHMPPYFIYHVWSMVEHPFDFSIELEYEATNVNGPYFKLGVGGHFLYHTESYTPAYKEFLNTFPDWTYTTSWIATYESWIY